MTKNEVMEVFDKALVVLEKKIDKTKHASNKDRLERRLKSLNGRIESVVADVYQWE